MPNSATTALQVCSANILEHRTHYAHRNHVVHVLILFNCANCLSNPDVEVANGDRIRFVKQVSYGNVVSIGFPCCPSSSRFRTFGASPKHAPAMSRAMCHAFQSKLPGSGPGAVAAAGLGTATFTIITIQKKFDVSQFSSQRFLTLENMFVTLAKYKMMLNI